MRHLHAAAIILLLIFAAGCTPLDFGYSYEDYAPTGAAVAPPEEAPAESAPAAQDVPADAAMPTRTITEGDLVSFPNLAATDADGDTIHYAFSQPLDAAGKWQTREGDAGEYTVTITASDGKDTVTQSIKIIVRAGNRAPVLHITDLTPRFFVGETVTIDASAEDPDGDPVSIVYSGWMDGATKIAARKDVGTHEVRVIASDGKKVVSERVHVRIDRRNSPPSISPLANRTLIEGETLALSPRVNDPDGDVVAISFSEPLDAQGSWTPTKADVGDHFITITASDGASNTTMPLLVTVLRYNRAPILVLNSAAIEVDEGSMVSIVANAEDLDGDSVTIAYEGWMTASAYQTTYEDAGVHAVKVTASDGMLATSQNVTITVRDTNRAPVFDPQSFI